VQPDAAETGNKWALIKCKNRWSGIDGFWRLLCPLLGKKFLRKGE
jgi:hypothetical protein